MFPDNFNLQQRSLEQIVVPDESGNKYLEQRNIWKVGNPFRFQARFYGIYEGGVDLKEILLEQDNVESTEPKTSSRQVTI